MRRSRLYNPFPGRPTSRHARYDDAADRDTRNAALNARIIEQQARREAAAAAAKEAAAQPAANDDQTEKKQHG